MDGAVESRTVNVCVVGLLAFNGVPLIVAVFGLKVNPLGNGGVTTGSHVRGGAPPVAVSVVVG